MKPGFETALGHVGVDKQEMAIFNTVAKKRLDMVIPNMTHYLKLRNKAEPSVLQPYVEDLYSYS